MIKHYNLDNCPNCISGIYLITFLNGKIYIGLSNNIKRRIKEHNLDSRQPILFSAIKKYGKIYEFDILEEIDSQDRELLLKKEIEYIAKYNSNDKNFGYNLTPGGNSYMKIYNPNALFSESDLCNIKQDLEQGLLSEKEIAEIYGCCENTIHRINTGKTYPNQNWNYPLRKDKKLYMGENNPNNKIKNDQIIRIIAELQDGILSMKEIAKKENCSSSLISAINNGKIHYNSQYNYPIRENKSTKNYLKLTDEEVNLIIDLLKERCLTMTQIGQKFNCSRDTIGDINNGKKYHKNNINYPIRLRSKKN